jgi:hypothetical protein
MIKPSEMMWTVHGACAMGVMCWSTDLKGAADILGRQYKIQDGIASDMKREMG